MGRSYSLSIGIRRSGHWPRPFFGCGLARWNKIDTNKILRPGQKLTMYVDVTAQSS